MIQHDHHHREHGVPRQRGIALPRGHDRADHHDLDPYHRQRQDKRPQRLAELHRRAFGVADNRQGRQQNRTEKPQKDESEPGGVGQAREPAGAEPDEKRRRDQVDAKRPLPPQHGHHLPKSPRLPGDTSGLLFPLKM